jgi:hypothetical protein
MAWWNWPASWCPVRAYGYGVAEVLATAKVTSIGGLVAAGILESKRGRVRLLRPSELSSNWDPNADSRDRLRNVVGRIESSWRPASAEESFEIVRRRLFEPVADPARFKDRDVTARAFADLYRTQQQEFPSECRSADYETRLRAAYPIHPEIFDRLYTDWSTLIKFQRTRGVLRLMAAVIHSLWEKGDRNPVILSATPLRMGAF